MKKIFLLMTIMTSLFFALSIDSNAFTFNNEDSPAGITLDTTINELNGYSLREVFEAYNSINIPFNNWSLFRLVNFSNTSFEYITETNFSGPTVTYLYTNNLNIIPNANYYIYASWEIESDSDLRLVTMDNNSYANGVNIAEIQNADADYNHFISGKFTDTRSTVRFAFQKGTSPNNELQRVTYPYLLNLDTHGLNLLTKDELDYYYSIYLLLKTGVNPVDLYSDYYTEGQIDGYSEGYGDGYSDGNDDGYNNGYSDGQEDGYDTGYLDGNVAGLETGYLNGYNDGYTDGVVEEVDTQWLLGFVTGTVNVLGVSIIPGISLGVFVFIPLFLGFIGFIFRLGGRRG